MALGRPQLMKVLVPLAVFAATLAVLMLINRTSSPPAPSAIGSADDVPVAAASTDDRIRNLKAALRVDPKNTNAYALLGNAYIQKARESSTADYQGLAEAAFDRALNQDPANAGALAGRGGLALSRHDFAGGLAYGQRALKQAPGVARIYGVIVDALVELGRYEDAERALQTMVDLKPNLDSYSRVSYFREIHGNLDGAVAAMRLAASAGGESPENFAYVQSLLGNLELERGRVVAAERDFRAALARYPGYGRAHVGLARVEESRGDLLPAIRRYRRAVALGVSEPKVLVALGEAEQVAGRRTAAERHFAAARASEADVLSGGGKIDADTALLEAEHGDPRKAVEIGRAAWAAAPSVRAADGLGWALTQAGRPREGLEWGRRALRIGTRDPYFLYHAGMSALAAGERGLARRYLIRSLADNPRFSPLHASRARRALATP